MRDLLAVDVCVQFGVEHPGAYALGDRQASSSHGSSAAGTRMIWTEVIWTDIPWTEWILRWLMELSPTLSPIDQYEMTLRLTTDAEIQRLNASYRNKDQSTDVLAFATLDLEDDLPPDVYQVQPYYLGDLIISLDTAVNQAREAGHVLTQELAWLASHGLLHLLGWDHPDAEQLELMLNKQRRLLELLEGIPYPSNTGHLDAGH